MFLDDVPVNYWAVFAAAIVYFIIGAIWYSSALFGHKDPSHPIGENSIEKKDAWKIGGYIGEFLISLIIAYVMAIFIQISQAIEVIEGISVALWIWIGFIATTHFSPVLWDRKTIKSFFIHTSFMLIGLLAMAATIMYFEI